MSDTRFLTERLATQILRYRAETLSATVISKTLDCVLDNIASCLAGFSAQPAEAARHVAGSTFAKGDAPIWFTATRSSVAGACWCNAMAASCLDFDDGHRLARGHPGSAIIPAVLAQAAHLQSSTPEILAAIAIGYEVAIRSAAAQQYERAQTHQSGRWTGFGVAAACGRLAGLDAHQLSNALAIVGVWAPNQQANGSSGYAQQTGNWAKEGVPVSALQALMAIDLSRQGFTGPKDLLDHKSHYDFAPAIGDVIEPLLILGTYFKNYACCRYIHPALDAYRALAECGELAIDSIERVEVKTFGWALRLANKREPDTLVDVQYSLPFCLAASMLWGDGALAPITLDLLADDRIPALATRVVLDVCPSIDAQFPSETLAKVRIVFKSGRILENISPVGPAELSSYDVRRKLANLAHRRLSDVQCQRLLDAADPRVCDLNALQQILGEVSIEL